MEMVLIKLDGTGCFMELINCSFIFNHGLNRSVVFQKVLALTARTFYFINIAIICFHLSYC